MSQCKGSNSLFGQSLLFNRFIKIRTHCGPFAGAVFLVEDADGELANPAVLTNNEANYSHRH
jgi:hypothetical protein